VVEATLAIESRSRRSSEERGDAEGDIDKLHLDHFSTAGIQERKKTKLQRGGEEDRKKKERNPADSVQPTLYIYVYIWIYISAGNQPKAQIRDHRSAYVHSSASQEQEQTANTRAPCYWRLQERITTMHRNSPHRTHLPVKGRPDMPIRLEEMPSRPVGQTGTLTRWRTKTQSGRLTNNSPGDDKKLVRPGARTWATTRWRAEGAVDEVVVAERVIAYMHVAGRCKSRGHGSGPLWYEHNITYIHTYIQTYRPTYLPYDDTAMSCGVAAQSCTTTSSMAGWTAKTRAALDWRLARNRVDRFPSLGRAARSLLHNH
jgi:hypothetical protein